MWNWLLNIEKFKIHKYMAQNKVTKPGGLSLDTSLVSQPEGTTSS
jgi:hypothetical protein